MVFLGIYTPHIKKGYWRFHIPLRKLLDAAGLGYGVRVRIKLYIEDVGELEKNLLLKSSYIDIHIPRKYSHLIKPNKKHKIYLVDVSRDVNRLERNTIIYGGGRKARIEIPQWYLKQNHITSETILRVEAEYDGEKHILFGRYRGAGPHIQSLPPMKTYPNKVTVTKIEKYSLEDFIDDFNRITQKTSNYRNIKLYRQEGKLTIVIDGEKVDIREHYLGTYAHYTYLIIRIHGIEGFKTLRIHNHGNKIKIYYLQHTKKHKLKDHAAYMPLERIICRADRMAIIYIDTNRRKKSMTYLILRKLNNKNSPNFINGIINENKNGDLYQVYIRLNKELWLNHIISIVNKQKLYHAGYKTSRYNYYVGRIGEKIFYEYLIKKGSNILKKNNFPWEHGTDIIFETKKCKWIVEIKTTINKRLLKHKLEEAIEQAKDRVKEIPRIQGYIGAAVILDTTKPQCHIIYRMKDIIPSPSFSQSIPNLTTYS